MKGALLLAGFSKARWLLISHREGEESLRVGSGRRVLPATSSTWRDFAVTLRHLLVFHCNEEDGKVTRQSKPCKKKVGLISQLAIYVIVIVSHVDFLPVTAEDKRACFWKCYCLISQ